MFSLLRAAGAATLVGCSLAGMMVACGGKSLTSPVPPDPALAAEGKDIFRFDTYGDETFWTDTLRMHEVIQAAVDPTTALSVGLKVDADALPPEVVQGIQSGAISLTDPATTVALLKLNAVVGLKGTVETIDGRDTLVRVGTTCALCHSTVDNSFSPGIGSRLDGWPNSDLNPGAIIALASHGAARFRRSDGARGMPGGDNDPLYASQERRYVMELTSGANVGAADSEILRKVLVRRRKLTDYRVCQ